MCSACITIAPAASNSAVEASRRSLMFAEWAERTSTAPISSQAARRPPSITWRVIGSSSATLHHHGVAACLCVPARRYHEGRARQLEDGRPVDLGLSLTEHRGLVLVVAEARPARFALACGLRFGGQRLRPGERH